jgi:hypothetical protein
MKMRTSGLWMLGFVVTLVACAELAGKKADSSSVEADQVFQSYKVIYDEGSDSLSVEAELRFQSATGPGIELVSPSAVELDGEPLSFIQGTTYKYGKKVSKPRLGPGSDSSHTLTWLDKSRNEVKTSFSLLAVAPNDVPALVSQSTNVEFSYILKDALDVSVETVVGSMIKTNPDGTVLPEVLSDSTDYEKSEVKYLSSGLKELSQGPMAFVFKRVLNTAVKGAPIDGRRENFGALVLEYRTKKKTLTITP